MKMGSNKINMNWKYQAILAVGTAILYTFLLWLFDYASEETSYTMNSLIFQGIMFGVVFGIGFPVLSKKFGSKFINTMGKNIQPVLEPGEEVQMEVPANLFRGIEAVGGKIFLTNRKLIFTSHSINIQTGQTEIDYADIKEVFKRKTANLVDNGIRVVTKDGKKYDYVVNERDLWVEKISDQIR